VVIHPNELGQLPWRDYLGYPKTYAKPPESPGELLGFVGGRLRRAIRATVLPALRPITVTKIFIADRVGSCGKLCGHVQTSFQLRRLSSICAREMYGQPCADFLCPETP
jgi:hypothetical protein